MRSKGYLIIAGSLNFFIAIMHIVAIFIGAPAYYFLDAPQLAIYTELGFKFPAWLTLFVTCFFFIFGLYAFCGAGSKVKLPFQSVMLKIIGSIFLLRGLFIIFVIYQQVRMPSSASLKEIVFSLLSLIIGVLYFLGVKQRGYEEEEA